MIEIEVKFLDFLPFSFLLCVLFLLLAEVFVYPGVVYNHIKVPIEVFLLFSAALVVFYKPRLPRFLKKTVFYITPFVLVVAILLNIEERLKFPNFVFSRYHVSLAPLNYLLVFFALLFLRTTLDSKKDFRKPFSLAYVLIERLTKSRLFLSLQKLFNRPKTKLSLTLILVFSLIFSFLIFKENFKAKWSIIDDHEIAYFLGSDKKILVGEIPKLLLKTEVSSYGKALRFRPSYYLVRIVESALWRDNPFLWYFARFVILSIFVFSVTFLVSRYFGLLPGIIFTLFTMTDKYWYDIWTRLGPSEIYVVLGLSLYSLSLYKILKDRSKPLFFWILFLLGGILAIGSKENMVILALPAIYLILAYPLIIKKSKRNLVYLSLHILFSFFVFLGVFLAVRSSGQNVYAVKISDSGLLQYLILGLKNSLTGLNLIFFAILFISFATLKSNKRIQFTISNNFSLFLPLFSYLAYVSQFVFYYGNWPRGWRYDFPGILSKYVFWLSSLYLFSKAVKDSYIFDKTLKNFIAMFSCLLFFGTLLFLVSMRGYSNLISAEIKNAKYTNLFTENMLNLARKAREQDSKVIIFRADDPWSYEPIFSLERFLRLEGVRNKIVLDYEDNDLSKRGGLTKKLSERLLNLSRDGDYGKGFGTFNEVYYKEGNCVLVVFSKTIVKQGCGLVFEF